MVVFCTLWNNNVRIKRLKGRAKYSKMSLTGNLAKKKRGERNGYCVASYPSSFDFD